MLITSRNGAHSWGEVREHMGACRSHSLVLALGSDSHECPLYYGIINGTESTKEIDKPIK